MSSADFFWKIGDMFQCAFIFYDVVQNYFNYFLIVLGFFGFFYWMNVQRKLSAKSNVPSEVSDPGFPGWYNEENKQIK